MIPLAARLSNMASGSADQPIITDWHRRMAKGRSDTWQDDPSYYAADPSSLHSSANTHAFMIGIGEDIFSQLQPALEAAEHEIIFVTCFWARSASRDRLSQSLQRLSDSVIASGGERIKVFIGFSSLSLWQKLFQTSSLNGKHYGPETWAKVLGLPDPLRLKGLDITIKSIFVRPFSVMHPKFVVIDRKAVYLPSCNVSWESWLEGCLLLDGPVVDQFITFWEAFWARDSSQAQMSSASTNSELTTYMTQTRLLNPSAVDDVTHITRLTAYERIPAIFLPSPHHLNPRFRPLPWQKATPVPTTPLNTFLLELFDSAKRHIYIQTPNLTCTTVLNAILSALKRGVDVEILTSERLMILEQLVTAGRTTKGCVKKLFKRHRMLQERRGGTDVEAQQHRIGSLDVHYYQPRDPSNRRDPVQSHLKLTIIDEEWTVLGSGNMDRASWYTSQELGLALHSAPLASEIRSMTKQYLLHRAVAANR